MLWGSAHAQNTWVHVRGAWEPPAGAVESMKAGLQRHVSINRGRSQMLPWHRYAFQYQGQVYRGRRYVLVNALCRVDPDWPLHAQMVLNVNGGSCYFHLKYDPAEGSFYDLFVPLPRLPGQ